MSAQYLWRYTNLPALIYILKEKKISLLDPTSWDDSNDSHFLSVYKNRKALNTLLAICFTQVPETYHHWRVFASGSSGVCIKFRRNSLLKAFNKHGGIKADDVAYLKLSEIKNQKPEIDQLPFIKRAAFEDECEFRVIFESSESVQPPKDIPIPLSCILKITLSPWAPKNLNKYIKEILRGINGCKKLEIVSSTIISNNEWKAMGGFLRRNK